MESRYKVVEIVDEKNIIIDYGSEDEANVGQEVRIIEKGKNVIDPDTQESLGELYLVKDEIEIVTVYPKFSVCSKIVKKKKDLLNPLSSFLVVQHEKVELKVDIDSSTNRKLKTSNAIKIGDIVVIL